MSKFIVKEWWHMVPLEEVPWRPDSEEDEREPFVQVFDMEGVKAMHDAIQAAKAAGGENWTGLLVDWDHESYDPEKRTTGAAYIVDSKVTPQGLYGLPRLSADGLRDVEGGMVRKLSPTILPSGFVDLGNGRKRAVRLDSVALTNRPRCKKLEPISNASREPEAITNTLPAKSAGEPSGGEAATTQENENMKLSDTTIAALLKKLGFDPATATEESILAGLEERPSSEDVTEMENRIGQLEDIVANRDLDLHGITDEGERKKFLPGLINNRDTTLIALEAISSARKQTTVARPMHNRATAAAPKTQPGEDATAEADAAHAQKVRARASEICNREGVAWPVAFNRAASEIVK